MQMNNINKQLKNINQESIQQEQYKYKLIKIGS